MKRRTFIKKSALMVGYGMFSPHVTGLRKVNDLDLLIKGGAVIDGTGKNAYQADIGILEDRLVAIGDLGDIRAERVLDATGLIVCPGFIDVHSHSEDELLVNPRAESKIRQGVTTEILGQDGTSVAPLNADMQSLLNDQYRSTYGLDVDWRDFAGYFSRLMDAGVAVNVGTLLGQGTLREFVVGTENRSATFREFDELHALARSAIEQGALGVSSGLEYTPGAFASREELIAICKAMRDFTGVYVTHMRNEGDFILEALDEAIEVANGAEVGLHISHLKCMGKRNWHKLDSIFDKIRQARFKGVTVTLDRYPYTAYNTNLSSLFPVWVRSGDSGAFLQRLADPELRERIQEETLAKVDLIGSWDAVLISSVQLEKNKYLLGKRISEVVSGNGTHGFNFVRQLIIEEGNGVEMCGFAMDEKNTAEILAHPSCMIATDASARADYGLLSHSQPHPRTYGTFPRFIGKYVQAERLVSLEEGIRKMTGLPAGRFGIRKRGKIREGFFADLVIFDSANFIDRATYNDPHQYPSGVGWVIVNGVVVVEQGEHTGQLAGRIV